MTRAPDFVGLAHLAIRAADVQRSAEWYTQVLGFQEPCRFGSTASLRHAPSRISIVLRPVDGLASGSVQVLDHFAFRVRDRAALEHWSRWLGQHGMAQEVEDTPIGSSITLRDPDDNEIELFVPAPAGGSIDAVIPAGNRTPSHGPARAP